MTSRLVSLLGVQSAAGASAVSLADQIRALVLDGRLTVGERLPSERALALELRRSRSTITHAYDVLAEGGYVDRVHGGGTRVTLPHHGLAPALASDDDAIDMSVASMGSTPGLYDATVRALPRLAALRSSSGYSLQGLPDFRDAVARRFTERGAPTSADEIVITAGAMQALNLVLSAIGRRGERALIEQPTFPHAIEALHRHGYRMLPTPVDQDGWDAVHVTDTLLRARPHIAYLIPDFHNPTGATLPDDARSVIAATARSAGTQVIVDETTAELDIDRGWAPVPFGALGPHVITIGSLSKVAWGGLRLGWIRADRAMIGRLLSTRASYDLGTAFLEQCIAVELLADLPELARQVRARLAAGRHAISAGLSALDGPMMPEVHGGLSAWIDLGSPVSTELSLAARAHGLILPPGPRFATGGVLERRMRIPITHDPLTSAEAMRRLALAWGDVRRGAPHPAETLARTAVI
ncbi:PLP-dependent aminotransferase family protein [Microbacterium bovistercoris]|uniref:PLP-dependent aminotransferase family protein n=1 Tax=Microbacterium bovistercoris TaxID=2293570 RepID=A0A371NUJ8_9MICO|nr:PLP-dependent aminotransferase family protein [Microbacterium bovistercoris]REJ05587.1 PLP-dependent aminotransferase family protein [Microbacterium bovistercoris]